MEEGAKGAGNPVAKVQKTPAEQLIPKSRLDEVISERNNERAQLQAMQQTVQNLTQMIQQQGQRSARPAENPYLKKLREEGRVDEARVFAGMEQQLVQQRQVAAALVDEVDRTRFITSYGKKGAKRLNEVEKLIADSRQRGNFNLSREQAYIHLLGIEQHQREQEQETSVPAQAPVQKPAQAARQVQYQDEFDAPSSDPNDVSSIRQGGASEGFDENNREGGTSDFDNIEF